MSFLEKLKKGIGIEEEPLSQEGFEGEESKLSSSPFAKAREVEEFKELSQPKKKSKKIKIEEKFVEPQEKIPKEIKAEEKKWPETEGQLAVDIYQTDNELVIQSTIAGVKPEDLEIEAKGDVVTIRGKREKVGDKERNYFYQECYWGPFSREIILPVEADASRAEATMTEGILTIRIPKIEREKKKKIIIK